jgi:hypothetical protein
VLKALTQFDPLWKEFSVWEQEQFIRELIREVHYDGPSQVVTLAFRSAWIKQSCEPTKLENEFSQ